MPNKKIRLEFSDDDVTLKVSPEYLKKYLIHEDNQAYLQYENGESVPLAQDYFSLLKAIEVAERG